LTRNRIVTTAGQQILRQGGVIRDIKNWGTFSLPRPISKHQMRHTRGHYFVMRFDAGSAAQDTVRTTMTLDPRVIRTACVKLGNGKLETLSRFGRIEWNKPEL
jgi:small subunit ribosomal protein S6